MNLSLINPYIRLAMESKISAGHKIVKRIIYDYELIYLEEGRFTLTYNNEDFICKAGDFIFIRPGISHSFNLNFGKISQPHIHFDITHRPQSDIIPISFKDYDKMSDSEKEWIHKDYFPAREDNPLININDKATFLDIFYKIVSGKLDDLTNKALMIQLLSIIILDNFNELYKTEKQASVITQIKDYIDAGNGMEMTLDDFSKTFFYNKFYLEKKFKETYGLSLIEYRNKKRMNFAKDLLKIHSVSKVSELLGYQSIYSFSRAYKNYFGYAPSKIGDELHAKA